MSRTQIDTTETNMPPSVVKSSNGRVWPTVPVVDVYHGVSVPDPYRWLEDQNSPETREFIEYQQQKARAYLDALPGREIIRKRVAEMLHVEEIRNPRRVGNHYFFQKLILGKEQPVIAMREVGSDKDEVLIDPAERNEGPTVSVDVICISPNARLMAYSVRDGGEDVFALEFFDVEQRRTLPDRLPKGKLRRFAFTPDSLGFFYIRENVDPSNPGPHAAYKHELGDDFAGDIRLFQADDDRQTRFSMSVSENGRFAVYKVRKMQGSLKTRSHFLQDLKTLEVTKLPWPNEAAQFKVFFLRNRLLGILKYESGKTSYVEIDPASPAESSWTPLLSNVTEDLSSVVFQGDLVLVPRIHGFASQTEILNNVGEHLGFIQYPARGSADLLSATPEGIDFLIRFESFFQPATIYRYLTESQQLEEFAKKNISFDAKQFEQTETWYESKDGTRVHMFVVGRKDLHKDRPVPTILTSYGGFGTNMTPRFSVFVAFLLEQGCRFVLPNIRGGAELGPNWHEAGKRHNRQKAFDDFIGAAEWLIQNDQTTSQQLAIFGGSNSGLLVGAAMTQRPDLFKAVLCIAPVLDMLRYDQFDRAAKWVSEYGVAKDPEDFGVLHSYSPYHKIEDFRAYPATLFVSGDADSRCNPAHVRKMVARLQAANSDGGPILMDYTASRGHTASMPLGVRVAALTDRLAFICQQLGIEVQESASCAA